jgi:hypothetical protein
MTMIETLSKIDDRLMMVALTVAIIAAYIGTRDPMLGEMMKYMLGATAGIMVARSQKQLVLSGGTAEAKAVVDDFLGDGKR